MAVLNGYLALGNMDAAGVVFTELVGAGAYVRQPVAFEATGSDSLIQNNAAIQFPIVPDRTWPSFRAYAVFDAMTGGRQLMAWDLGTIHSVRATRRHTVGFQKIVLRFPRVESSHGSEVIMASPFLGSSSAAAIARLVRIMETALGDNPFTRPLHANPPTVSISPTGDGALTTFQFAIAGALTSQATDKIAWYGGVPTPISTVYVAMPVTSIAPATPGNIGSPLGSLNSWANFIEFETDAPTVQLVYFTDSTYKLPIQVDGRYVTDYVGVTGPGVAADSNVKLVFTDGKSHRIRFGGSTYPGRSPILWKGLRLAALYSFWKPSQKDVIRAGWIGDSWPEGTNGAATVYAFPNAVWPQLTAEQLGIRDMRQLVVGATGYISSNAGTRSKAIDTIPFFDNQAPFDIFFISHGFNDSGQTPAAVTAAALAFYQALRTRYPSVPIVVFGCQAANSGPSAAVIATENAIAAAVTAFADPFCKFVPVSTDPSPWMTGTGKVGATNSTGNSDFYIDNDGTHPTFAGHNMLSFRSAQGARTAVASMLA